MSWAPTTAPVSIAHSSVRLALHTAIAYRQTLLAFGLDLENVHALCNSPLIIDPRRYRWIRRIGIALFLALLAVVLFPSLLEIAGLSLGLGFVLGIKLVELLGAVIVLAGIPLFLAWIICDVAYPALLKPYVRAWHINRIRNSRYLHEAAERGGQGN